MPYRAGYFVLAYSWDHHCRRLYDSLDERLLQVEREVAELQSTGADEPDGTRDRHEKWRASRALCRRILAQIEKRQYVINSLGYRGYGVNRDFLAALGSIAKRGGRLVERIEEQLRGETLLPCDDDGAQDGSEAIPDSDPYWQVMARETSMEANTAIFERMFFSAGCASMTIMKGSTGLHNGRSCQELKLRANADFVRTVRGAFASLADYTEIGIGMLEHLHRSLTRDLDRDAGSFRRVDFPDRNGVTFEFGNFSREISDLAIVLAETARSFHHRDEFIYNLARSYYMFMGIHPFWDGNGRVGRCFLNFLFMKKGLPPITLNSDEEVFALPRYGGSMEDMHHYLGRRLHRAAVAYLHERQKLDTLGLLGKRIHNASFDSGFDFRQIDGRPAKVEVHFEALVIDDNNDLSRSLKEECRVVLPEARLLSTMIIYCGFCDTPFSEWQYPFRFKGGFHISELVSDGAGVRTFDVDFLVDIPRRAGQETFFACSVVSEEKGLLFNNKGLNYSCRLES